MAFPRPFILLAIALSVFAPTALSAYDSESHESFGVAAARRSVIDLVLRERLGVPAGIETELRQGTLSLTPGDWVGRGAREEDFPHTRVFNHFHNPLRPWPEAGLDIGFRLGDSSIHWSQRGTQEPGGTWTWAVARQAFLDALTGLTPGVREQRLAATFETLGHLTHLPQDATVPAHVRNDPHLSIPFLFGRFIPFNSDWYEDWVEAGRTTQDAVFGELLALAPVRPQRSVFRSSDPAAPVAIAGLIDTDQLTAGGRRSSVFDPPDVGVAEFTNQNFLSRDTIFRDFARPDRSDLGPGFFEPEGPAFRQYFPKVVAGTSAVEIPHFVAEGVLTRHLTPFSTEAPPTVLWHLDRRVHEAYARELIPRAIGYSAELIDYFFRGRLDVDLTLDPLDPARVRLTGTNGSDEPLVDGSLTLYADTTSGQRVRAASIDPTTVVGIGAGTPLAATRFEAPADAERFVAVYQGTLGLERKTETSPGAVAGKVLGGVRVEAIFADGPRWRLRTPVAVFDLPLDTSVYDDVTWGDGDDLLVARTPLGLDPPGWVATFEIARRPGSVEPVTSGTPPVVTLRAKAVASLAFAAAPLVTTIVLDQTVEYRQQIGRWRQELAVQWVDSIGSYETVSVTRTPIAFETLHAETVSFAQTIPIRLDAQHNLDLGDADRPYVWELVDVAADRDGRILGLIAIFLTQPEIAPARVPWFRLDAFGSPFVRETRLYEATFPDDAAIIWALVDLGRGAVVASTAAPTVTMTSRRAEEGPPWGGGGGGESTFPAIYRTAAVLYSGGPRAGEVDQIVEPPGLAPRLSPDGVGATLEATVGDQSLVVSGWFQPEIRAALAPSGLGDFQAGELRTITQYWNYVCATSPCNLDSHYLAFGVVNRIGGVPRPPAQLIDARRARPAPAGERLALLGDAFHDASRPVGSVVAWDVALGRAREALRVPASFHGLGPHASTGAVLLSYRPRTGTSGTFVVPLDEGRVETFLPAPDLPFDFALLAPERLYNVRDWRFYRIAPALEATPLPARLTPVPGNPIGDYHAIRVP